MTTDIINQRHAVYRTPNRRSSRWPGAAGRAAIAREKIVRGYDSEVYIVRIRQHGGGHFADEAWAIAPCRAAGVPAPELLLCEMVTMGEHPREVIVQRRVAGRALSEIEDMLTPEQRAVLEGAKRKNSRGLL